MTASRPGLRNVYAIGADDVEALMRATPQESPPPFELRQPIKAMSVAGPEIVKASKKAAAGKLDEQRVCVMLDNKGPEAEAQAFDLRVAWAVS